MSVKLFGSNKYIELKWWTFPGGERNVRVVNPPEVINAHSMTVECHFEGSDDLIDILLLVNACRNISRKIYLRLKMPYFPFTRQDRVMSEGEPLALQVAANLIKSCDFTEIEVWDVHSDVLAGMFDPGKLFIRQQDELILPILYGETGNYAVVSPDAGALKKIYKLAKRLNCDVIEASKLRDVRTGNITGVSVDLFSVNKYNKLFVVDDICDGGKTFTELGKEIRKSFEGELVLCVTHGIFSKGLEVFDGIYNDVICINDMRNVKNV